MNEEARELITPVQARFQADTWRGMNRHMLSAISLPEESNISRPRKTSLCYAEFHTKKKARSLNGKRRLICQRFHPLIISLHLIHWMRRVWGTTILQQ